MSKRQLERAEIDRRIAALSPREHDVMRALVKGQMNKQEEGASGRLRCNFAAELAEKGRWGPTRPPELHALLP